MYINHTHLSVVRITISNQKTHQVDGEYSRSATGVLYERVQSECYRRTLRASTVGVLQVYFTSEYSRSATGILRYHSGTFPGNVLHSILAGHTGPPRNYPESQLRGKPGFEAGPGPCNTSMHRQLSVVFLCFFFNFCSVKDLGSKTHRTPKHLPSYTQAQFVDSPGHHW